MNNLDAFQEMPKDLFEWSSFLDRQQPSLVRAAERAALLARREDQTRIVCWRNSYE